VFGKSSSRFDFAEKPTCVPELGLSLSQIESGWRCWENRATLCRMADLLRVIFGFVIDLFRSRAALEAEILVLRQQIIVLSGVNQAGCRSWP
jgi:hypothetical protein